MPKTLQKIVIHAQGNVGNLSLYDKININNVDPMLSWVLVVIVTSFSFHPSCQVMGK